MFQPKLDISAMCIYTILYMYVQSCVFSDLTAAKILFVNLPKVLMSLLCIVIYHFLVVQFCKLTSERDLFKSGHLQFVHNFKEGMVIMHDHFMGVKLINVAARQMLQLPFSDEAADDPE